MVDDAYLNANRLQDVVDCAEEGETVALRVSKAIRLDRALVVKKNITIKSTEVSAKATMTCPPKDSLLFVEYGCLSPCEALLLSRNVDVVLENIIIQDCPFQEGLDIKSIVTLKCDEVEDESFMLTLLNVDFMNDDKSGELTSIDVEHPKCFSVIEKKVEQHKRGLQSIDLSSEEKDQSTRIAIVSPSWEARDLQVTHNRITWNVENQNCSINHYLIKDYKECVECEKDEYNFHPDTETCKSCPNNADCSEEYVLPRSGHWNSFPCSKHIQECINKDACLGLDPSLLKEIISLNDPVTCLLSMEDIKKYRDAQCADGYQDLLCGSCKDDYGKIGFLDCIPCRNRVLTLFSLIFTTCLLIYSAWEQISASLESINARLLRRLQRPIPEEREANVQQAFQRLEIPEQHVNKAQNAKTKFAIVLQIFVNFMQALGAALSLNRSWSTSVNRLLDTSNWISQNVSQVYTFSFECLLPAHGVVNRSFLSSLLAMFVPFMIIWIVWMYWFYDTFYLNRPWRHFAKRGILSALSILDVSFFSLATTACFLIGRVRVFEAVSLDDMDASHEYWFKDTSIKGPWSSYYVVALMIYTSFGIFFLFCFAALSVVFHFVRRRDAFESEWVRETFGVMFIGFRRARIYWELFIIMRKLLVSIILFLVEIRNNRRWGIAMAVAFTYFLYLHLKNLPYRTDFGHLNFLEGISLFVCGLTAMICTMLAIRIPSSSITRAILISIVTISSMLAFIIFGYHLVTNKFIEIKYTLMFEGVVNEDDNVVVVIFKYWRTKLRNIIKSLGNFVLTLCSSFNLYRYRVDGSTSSSDV